MVSGSPSPAQLVTATKNIKAIAASTATAGAFASGFESPRIGGQPRSVSKEPKNKKTFASGFESPRIGGQPGNVSKKPKNKKTFASGFESPRIGGHPRNVSEDEPTQNRMSGFDNDNDKTTTSHHKCCGEDEDTIQFNTTNYHVEDANVSGNSKPHYRQPCPSKQPRPASSAHKNLSPIHKRTPSSPAESWRGRRPTPRDGKHANEDSHARHGYSRGCKDKNRNERKHPKPQPSRHGWTTTKLIT